MIDQDSHTFIVAVRIRRQDSGRVSGRATKGAKIEGGSAVQQVAALLHFSISRRK